MTENNDELLPTAPKTFRFTAAQLYDSLPLSPDYDQIRVLDLDTSRGDAQQNLTGTLRVISLQASPVYAALSYVWGAWSTPPDTIICNGCAIEVSANCHSALQSLQTIDGKMSIWVDAFCINQKDDVEKAHQIQLMSKIYTFAQPTYVWLGEGSESSDKAMECIEHASRLRFIPPHIPWLRRDEGATLRMARQKTRKQFWRLWFRTHSGSRRSVHPYSKHAESLSDVAALLDRPWINRVWTFQEITLASAPVIICGRKKIEWSAFSQGVDFLFDGGASIHNFLPIPVAAKFYNMTLDMPQTGPWIDLIRFWGNVPRPISWNGNKLRDAAEDEIWTADRYQVQYLYGTLRGFTRASKVIQVIVLVSFGILGLGLMVVMPAFIKYPKFDTSNVNGNQTTEADKAPDTKPKFNDKGFWIYFGLLMGSMLVSVSWSFIGVLDMHMRSDMGSINSPSRDRTHDHSTVAKALLAQTIRVLQVREATNPRDKAFALYGVLNSLRVKTSPPDYSKTPRQIYRELFCSLLLKNKRCINLLLLAGPSNNGTASWIPNWENVGDTAWLNPQFYSDMIRYYPLRSRPFVRVEQDQMFVRCMWSGQVTYASGILPRIAFPCEDLDGSDVVDEECAFVSAICQWLLNVPQDQLSIHKAQWLDILLADAIEFGYGRVQVTDEFSELYGVLFDKVITQLLPGFRDTDRIPSTSTIAIFLKKNTTLRRLLFNLSERICHKRCFIYSPDVGLGTAGVDTRPGDRIGTVMGLAAPLILRENGPTMAEYQVVGPAVTEKMVRWVWTRTRYSTLAGGLNMTLLLVALKEHELTLAVPEEYRDLDRFEEVVLV